MWTGQKFWARILGLKFVMAPLSSTWTFSNFATVSINQVKWRVKLGCGVVELQFYSPIPPAIIFTNGSQMRDQYQLWMTIISVPPRLSSTATHWDFCPKFLSFNLYSNPEGVFWVSRTAKKFKAHEFVTIFCQNCKYFQVLHSMNGQFENIFWENSQCVQ